MKTKKATHPEYRKGLNIGSDLSLLITALIWGTGFPTTQYAIDAGLSTSLILFLRFGIATLVLGLVAFRRLSKMRVADWKTGIPAGVLMGVAFFAQTLGLRFTTPSNNAFITATNVIMVPFIAWFFVKSRPPARSFLLALSTFAGIVVLSFGSDQFSGFSIGDFYTLLCAMLFAGHIIYLEGASRKMDTVILTFVQMLTAFATSFLFFAFLDGFSFNFESLQRGFLPVCYLGLFSTLLCFFIQTSAQKKTSSTKTAIFLSTEALFGTLFSLLLALEPFSWNMVIGGGIILASITAAELLPNSKK